MTFRPALPTKFSRHLNNFAIDFLKSGYFAKIEENPEGGVLITTEDGEIVRMCNGYEIIFEGKVWKALGSGQSAESFKALTELVIHL